MFDLEERIRHWRQAQAHALGGRAEVLDELESHLREEFAQPAATPKQRQAGIDAAVALVRSYLK